MEYERKLKNAENIKSGAHKNVSETFNVIKHK